mgnify:CR=1 FL=1
MRKLLLYIFIAALSVSTYGQTKVLVFSKTDGYRHASIEYGVGAVIKLGLANDFIVTATEDARWFRDDELSKFKAVVFLNTTENVLNRRQQKALKKFINQGGGFVGIHAAADTEYKWEWYNGLVGAYFESHPEQQSAQIHIKQPSHPVCEGLPQPWEHFDEWYNYKSVQDGLTVLLEVDEGSYQGGNMGKSHPIAWYREYDGGRMFYTGLGHTIEAYQDPLFLRHLLGGIQYVLERD